jgi:S-adenosylhomocysteine hydrolase
MSSSFANQVIAQMSLARRAQQQREVSGRRVRAAQASGRKGRAIAAQEAGAMLTELTDKQARYIGVMSAARTNLIRIVTRGRLICGLEGVRRRSCRAA